ncbi:MAG: hypothetical protein ACK56I_11725 [bacterium]
MVGFVEQDVVCHLHLPGVADDLELRAPVGESEFAREDRGLARVLSVSVCSFSLIQV